MAGSAIVEQLKQVGFDVYWTWRSKTLVQDFSRVFQLDIQATASAHKDIAKLIAKVKPHFIINALRGYDENLFLINSVVPALLEQVALCPVINISSNAVFQNAKSRYFAANAEPKPITEYGMSKWLGERPTQLTIRTSIIGVPVWDIDPVTFIRRNYTSRALKNYMWNGVTTLTLAKVVAAIICRLDGHPSLYTSGIMHLCSTAMRWPSIVTELVEAYQTYDALIIQKEDSLPLLLRGYKVTPTIKQQIAELVSPDPYRFQLEQFNGLTRYIYTRKEK